MNQFLGSIIITVFLLCTFFFGIRYMATEGMDPEVSIDFENRARAVFAKDVNKEDKNFPFVIEVLVQEESQDTLILDIMCYVPENDELVYVLSVRPERSDFKNDDRTLKPGMNVERVTVYFSPTSIFKRRVTTEYLLFYINPFGESEIDKTYIRKAAFIKTWRKQKYRGLFLRRSEFRTL